MITNKNSCASTCTSWSLCQKYVIKTSPYLLVIFLCTNSMEQSPSWEANSHSACYDIPGLLWNLNVHYCICNRLQLDPILCKMNPFHILTHYFLKIHFIIVPSMPRFPEVVSSLQVFCQEFCMYFLSLPTEPHGPPASSIWIWWLLFS